MLVAIGTRREVRSDDQTRWGITQHSLRIEVEMDLFSFIDCSNRTQSLSALFDLLVDCAAKEGFSEIA